MEAKEEWKMLDKIHLIAPYAGLAALGTEINQAMNWNINVQLGNLEDSIPFAKTAQQQGARAIISRGGTASIIRSCVDIPVIEIEVTGYDILKALYPYRNSNAAVGVIGYRNVVAGCKDISSILNIPMENILIPNEPQLDWNIIRQQVKVMIKRYKIDVIVGDTVIISKFNHLAVKCQLITSGKEAVLQAVDVAQKVIRAQNSEKEKFEKFRAVLNFIHDGVVVTDENGIVTATNPCAEAIFGLSGAEMQGKQIAKIIKNFPHDHVLKAGAVQLAHIQSTANEHVVANSVPILIDGTVCGSVSTFKKVSEIQKMEREIRKNLYAKGLVTKYTFPDIMTKDQQMLRLLTLAQNYAKTDATVLIAGESGTGKEMLAQSIHAASPRAKGPFVAVNCAALPPQLLESELFGYVEGAFTGAAKGGKTGLFELAHNGTIFLDEIGELALPLQARLLRTLQEKQVMRLGSDKIIPIDIRVIVATNINLRQAVREEKFRRDLYYRINVLNLKTIPLRDRKSDIEFLCYYFLQCYNHQYGKQVKKIQPEVLQLFHHYSWPGNIREMKNIMERIVISTNCEEVAVNNIDLLIDEMKLEDEADGGESNGYNPDSFLQGTMEEIKVKIIKAVLEKEKYNKTNTAKRLQINRSTINRLL
ncbi:MAG: sigma 54-interacting transcriptional regulator [Veillonellales bacterium]